MRSTSDKIYNWEGLIFNLLCALYCTFLGPSVLAVSTHNLQEEASFMPWFGIVLLTISLLETYALPKKMNYVHKSILNHQDVAGSGFVLWMFHLLISLSITVAALKAFDINVLENGASHTTNWYAVVLLVLVVIKELYLLLFIVGGFGEEEQLNNYERPNKKEWICDLILCCYACIAYTVIWESMTEGMRMEKENPPMFLLNICVSSLLFLFFYLPLRIPYYLEEMAQIKTKKEVLKFVFSILIVLIFVIAKL